MPDNTLSFEDFLAGVDPRYRDFVTALHDLLLRKGCKLKLARATSGGYVVSYSDGIASKVLMNFVFRKSGLVARIYGDNVNAYEEFISALPPKAIKAIEKATACRLCNPRCGKGYTFTLNGAHHQKCRYNCFMIAVDDDSAPYIEDFVARELAARGT